MSAALIALACLLVPFGALAAWAVYGIADGDRYVTVMAPLATDPAVRNAVADTVSAGIMREVHLGGPAARQTVAPFVHDAVRSFTRTDTFRTAWNAGNRVTYDAVWHALHDDRETTVTVDLAPVTAEVREQLAHDHVPLAEYIPVEHTAVAVLPARDLDGFRKGFHVLEFAGFWLPVTAVTLAAAGITVAVRRRRAVIATALGTALGGALLALALAIGRHFTLAGLPQEVSHPAVAAIYDTLTGTLNTCAWLLLALGTTVAAAARVTQHPRLARLTRLTRLLRRRRAAEHERELVPSAE
ncbi:hypothetical protein [Streptomyces sp. YIM S03343]